VHEFRDVEENVTARRRPKIAQIATIFPILLTACPDTAARGIIQG